MIPTAPEALEIGGELLKGLLVGKGLTLDGKDGTRAGAGTKVGAAEKVSESEVLEGEAGLASAKELLAFLFKHRAEVKDVGGARGGGLLGRLRARAFGETRAGCGNGVGPRGAGVVTTGGKSAADDTKKLCHVRDGC